MQQTAANPYRSPAASVADQDADEFSDVKIFSAAGRLGRVRYIGYSVGMTLLFYLVIGLGAGLSAGTGIGFLGGAVIVAGVVGMLIVGVLLTIQRCHDFDMSGWLSLLLVVPLAPLLFWIIPGTKGGNRFGAPTPPNSTGVVLLALIFPMLFVVGILAAIAIPAYQDYVHRANAAQAAHQSSPPQAAPLDQAPDEGLGEDTGEGGEEAAMADRTGDETAAASETEQPDQHQ